MIATPASMVDVDPYMVPHRKAVGMSINSMPQAPRVTSHTHTRTVSSSIFPMQTPISQAPTSYQYTINGNRRTPSNATASSNSSNPNLSLHQTNTNSSLNGSLRRSTSSRSGQSVTATSYVALMRKQKATVWCDRAQQEDPRALAQAKIAKTRATLEVMGGNSSMRTSTSGSMGNSSLGVRSKIRHHTTPRSHYGSVTIGGVPMRLSASEIENDTGDDDTDSQRNLYNQRSGSGRSSFVSNANGRLANHHQRVSGHLSQGSTPPSGGQDGSPAETPVPSEQQRREAGDYFPQPSGESGSGGSSERESSFGNVGDMKGPTVAGKKDEKKSIDELNRRGSVDERAATMRGVRLFVANPDLSD